MKEFTQLADLAAERLGGRALEANDDFFAPKENLLKESQPVFIAGKYTSRGKWMDGWESRRRRTPGFDWCLIRLGLPGVIRGVLVDTSFFTGNYPERFSLEGCVLGKNRVGYDFSRDSPKGRYVESLRMRIRAAIHALAVPDFSRRWRGAAARLWRGGS